MADPVQGEGKQSSCTALSGEGRHSHQVQRLATNSLSLLNLISACRVLEVPPQPGAQPHKGSSCSAWNATPGCRAPACPPAAAAAVGGSSSARHVHHLCSVSQAGPRPPAPWKENNGTRPRLANSQLRGGSEAGTEPWGAQHGALVLSTRPGRQHGDCGGPAKNGTALAQGQNI